MAVPRPVSHPFPFEAFAQLPLHRVVPELRARLDALTLAEVEALVRPGPVSPPSSVPDAPARPLRALASAALDLPTRGSKLAEMEWAVVQHALETTSANVSAAARLLGIDRKALERKIARYKRRRA